VSLPAKRARQTPPLEWAIAAAVAVAPIALALALDAIGSSLAARGTSDMLSHAELAGLAGRSYAKPWSGVTALDCEYDLLPRGDNELVVAIPGTHPDDPLDWIRDLSAVPWPFPTIGICHSGFGAGGTAIAERVRAALRDDGRLITVVGHSLGGAMALIVGARLIAAGKRVRIVTFGAPRVAFIANFALSHFARDALELAEYRRAGDPVPGVPPRPIFRHVSGGIAIGVDCGDPIGDHAISRYAADLAAPGTKAA
jgi:hypothetical protein